MSDTAPALVFEDAAPIPTNVKGSPKEPNPYLDIVKAIALKTTVIDGKTVPLAKSFTIARNADEELHTKNVEKIRRQMGEAGKASDPKVTVKVRDTAAKLVVAGKPTSKDDPSKARIVFWTIAAQKRPRKPVETPAVAVENPVVPTDTPVDAAS